MTNGRKYRTWLRAPKLSGFAVAASVLLAVASYSSKTEAAVANSFIAMATNHASDMSARIHEEYDVTEALCKNAGKSNQDYRKKLCGESIETVGQRYTGYPNISVLSSGRSDFYANAWQASHVIGKHLLAWIDANGIIRTSDINETPAAVKKTSNPIAIHRVVNKLATFVALTVKPTMATNNLPTIQQTILPPAVAADTDVSIKPKEVSVSAMPIVNTPKASNFVSAPQSNSDTTSFGLTGVYKKYSSPLMVASNNTFFQFSLPTKGDAKMNNTRVIPSVTAPIVAAQPAVQPQVAATVVILPPAPTVSAAAPSPKPTVAAAAPAPTTSTEDMNSYYGLTAAQLKLLPESVQKLAKSSDPSDGVRFAKEAEANFLARKDPTLVAPAMEVIKQGLEVAKSINMDTPAVAQLVRDYTTQEQINAGHIKEAARTYNNDTVLIQNGYSINIIRGFSLG